MPVTIHAKTHTRRVRGGLIVSSQVASSSQEATSIIRHPENLPAEQEEQDRDLKLLMDEAVTELDWLDIFRKAKEMALGGGQVGVKAMEFLAKYRWGLPAQMMGIGPGEQSKITIVEVVRQERLVERPEIVDGESVVIPQEKNVPF